MTIVPQQSGDGRHVCRAIHPSRPRFPLILKFLSPHNRPMAMLRERVRANDPRHESSLPSSSPASDAKESREVTRGTKDDKKAIMLMFLVLFLCCGSTLWPVLNRYGSLILYSPESKRLSLTDSEVDAILDEHQFIFLGGPHRGGTTLLWQLLSAHSFTGGFPENSDSDFGEGAFLQTVLPTFGVGDPRQRQRQTTTGLGRYAFDPASHMTETHVTNSAENMKKLISEWSFYWNLSQPVLLE